MSEFKVGDRVRYIHGDSQWNADDNEVAYGMEGIVSDINDDGEIEVSYVRRFCDDIDPDNLELVTPADQKREFLERLQSLMREYNVKIDFGGNDKGLGFIFCIGKDSIIIPYAVGTGEIDPFGFPNLKVESINADNIMDFEKF